MASKRFAEEYDEWSSEADKKKKKKKSRWGENDVSESAVLTGLPTVIPQGLTREQEEQYLLQLQIEEITRRLKTGELGIPPNPEDRSPSPEPMYNNEGKRLNTREFRTRKKLEEERHNLIQKVLAVNPEYKSPADYRPPLIRIHDKVMIPQDDHPEINFVGLLIGPRGNTLRSLEKETGTSIIIRGKGSVKEGKVGHKDGKPLPGQDEPLHAYITANTYDNVKKAVKRIKEIIHEGILVPDAENDLRKQQLRELALLNGTLREGDALSKLKQFQEAQTIVTNTILCTICGGAGHISADCKQKRPGDSLKEQAMNSAAPMYNPNARAKMDSEYMSLMAELGQRSGGVLPHPNSIRTRIPLQLPEPKLAITGGSSGPWAASGPPPTGPSAFAAPPPPSSTTNQGSGFSGNSSSSSWQNNSAGPISLPPPVRPPPPPLGSFWQGGTTLSSSSTSSSSGSGKPGVWNNNSQTGNTSSSSSGGGMWNSPPPTGSAPRPSSSQPSGSWGNNQGNRWSNSSAPSSNNSSGGNMWGNNSAPGGSSSSWGNNSSNTGSSWSNSWAQSAGNSNSWSGGTAPAASGGSNGGRWGGGGMMSRPPVPPTPPSFNRWSNEPPANGYQSRPPGAGGSNFMAPPPPPPN